MKDYIFLIPDKEPLIIPCEDIEQAYNFAKGLVIRENKPVHAYLNDDETQEFTINLKEQTIDCLCCLTGEPDCKICNNSRLLIKNIA